MLEKRRGRRIHLHSWNALSSQNVCGAWIASDTADHIFYAGITSKAHQRHIVLHEIAHMLWGHELLAGDAALAELFPNLPPNTVRRMLLRKRARYESVEEQQAEMTATILGQTIEGLTPKAKLLRGPLLRLQGTLGGEEEMEE
jgi:hypothetical protein